MKRKVKIIFELDIEYPTLEKETKQLSKNFDSWLVKWSSDPANQCLPLLYKKFKNEQYQEYLPEAVSKVTVIRDKETILSKSFEIQGEIEYEQD